MRLIVNKTVADVKLFKKQLLNWSQQFREITLLDSNDYPQEYATYDCVLAADAFTAIKTDFHNAFEDLKQYQQTTGDWLFGYLTYDLKNDNEDLKSKNFDGLEFPDLFFYQPKRIFFIKGNTVEIRYLNFCDDELESDFDEIQNTTIWSDIDKTVLHIEQRISKSDYLNKVGTLMQNIQKGNIYEANFCMEFYAKKVQINPLETFSKLNEISQPPFSVFFKNHKQYLLCASPERYLKKVGEDIISQPIKGTAKRYSDKIADQKSKFELENNPKERAENIMITDLVRNDLSHTAQRGSVQVKALCEIKSFMQVHQMISTITSKFDSKHAVVDLIRNSFPMGSMTGAPKISAMKMIEELEETKRGLYSGAVGYFTPNGDFDFNVVIRSILYNQENKYVSFSVGSAITSLSDPENEYEECLLKAKAMREVLE
ncbi:anthranilate synthase component I family protein [Flavobacterium algicola]|uniref:anthranilate synthase component I family protein n=1 Tax=Flavobacterium algicola TaxID=556529 RepID=UPI001EFD859B|nr:anthranilate synthase component I family protein [Flavobacterium algicola]MCG9792975.1 anthranilate synthase component I family protein [Flavobacterium algicola]